MIIKLILFMIKVMFQMVHLNLRMENCQKFKIQHTLLTINASRI